MTERPDFIVPVTIKDSYWSAVLYFPAHDDAASAKLAAQGLMDELAAYAKPARPFVVGDATQVS